MDIPPPPPPSIGSRVALFGVSILFYFFILTLILGFFGGLQVMSDEFNTPNRTFTDGHDPVWTALDKPDDDSSSAGGGSPQGHVREAL